MVANVPSRRALSNPAGRAGSGHSGAPSPPGPLPGTGPSDVARGISLRKWQEPQTKLPVTGRAGSHATPPGPTTAQPQVTAARIVRITKRTRKLGVHAARLQGASGTLSACQDSSLGRYLGAGARQVEPKPIERMNRIALLSNFSGLKPLLGFKLSP